MIRRLTPLRCRRFSTRFGRSTTPLATAAAGSECNYCSRALDVFLLMFACGLLLARAAIVTHFVMKCRRSIIKLARARDVALQIHVCDFLLQCRAAGGGDGICCSHRKKARENRDAYSSQNNGQCVGASSFQFGGWFDVAYIFLRVVCLTCCSQFTLAEDYHQKQVIQPFPLSSSGSPCEYQGVSSSHAPL
jgi:hypothetical protein